MMKYIEFDDFTHNNAPVVWFKINENTLLLVAIKKRYALMPTLDQMQKIHLQNLVKKIVTAIANKLPKTQADMINVRLVKDIEHESSLIIKDLPFQKGQSIIIQNAQILLTHFSPKDVPANKFTLNEKIVSQPAPAQNPLVYIPSIQKLSPSKVPPTSNRFPFVMATNAINPTFFNSPPPQPRSASFSPIKKQIPPDNMHHEHGILVFYFPKLILENEHILWRPSSKEGYVFFIKNESVITTLYQLLMSIINSRNITDELKNTYCKEINYNPYENKDRYILECRFATLVFCFENFLSFSLDRPPIFEAKLNGPEVLSEFKNEHLPSLFKKLKNVMDNPTLLIYLTMLTAINSDKEKGQKVWFNELDNFLIALNLDERSYLDAKSATERFRQYMRGTTSFLPGNYQFNIDAQNLIINTCNFLEEEKKNLNSQNQNRLVFERDKPHEVYYNDNNTSIDSSLTSQFKRKIIEENAHLLLKKPKTTGPIEIDASDAPANSVPTIPVTAVTPRSISILAQKSNSEPDNSEEEFVNNLLSFN